MKKQNIIIISVIAFVLVVAVGYALFSQNINITGTATASGSFDIDYKCELAEIEGINNAEGKCSVDGNTITMTNTINKPTDATFFKVTLTNNGTIPARITSIKSLNNKASDYKTKGDALYLDDETLLAAYYVFNDYSDNDGDVLGDNDYVVKKITLEPGDSTDMTIFLGWADSEALSLDTQPNLENGTATINYNITLGFTQATD